MAAAVLAALAITAAAGGGCLYLEHRGGPSATITAVWNPTSGAQLEITVAGPGGVVLSEIIDPSDLETVVGEFELPPGDYEVTGARHCERSQGCTAEAEPVPCSAEFAVTDDGTQAQIRIGAEPAHGCSIAVQYVGFA